MVGCDLITNVPLDAMMETFRLHLPACVTLMAEPVTTESQASGVAASTTISSSSSKMDHTDAIFVGLDATNETIVYLKSADDCNGKFNVRMGVLNQYSTLNIYSTLKDVHAYIFNKWVMDLIVQKPKMSSLREDVLPYLVRLQTSPGMVDLDHVEKLLINSVPKDSLMFAMSDENKLSLADTAGMLSDRFSALSSSLESRHDVTDTEDLVDTDEEADNVDEIGSFSSTMRLPLAQQKSMMRCIVYVPAFATPAKYCVRANNVPAYVDMNRHFMRTADNRVSNTAEINPKTQVGPDSMVGEGTKIDERSSVKKSVIGSHCSIGRNVKVVNSIVMDYVILADGVKLDGCIVCHGATIKEKSALKDCEVSAYFVVDTGVNAKAEHFVESRSMSTDDENY